MENRHSQPNAFLPYATATQLVSLRLAASELVFFPRMMAKSQFAGDYKSRLRGRGMDFDEVRPYQAGDDIRTIDWRVTARTNVPHTKLFREERERPILLVCDLRPSMFFGSQGLKSVTACEVAALLAWAGLRANDRVGGLVFSPDGQREIRSKRSHHSVLQLVHFLEQGSRKLAETVTENIAENSPSLTDICRDIRRVVHPGSSVFLISDFHDFNGAAESELFQVSRHSDLTLLRVYDHLESQMPPPGQYPIFDGRQRSLLNAADGQLRTSFEQQAAQRLGYLKQAAGKLGIRLLHFKTGQPPTVELRQVYGRNHRGTRAR
ncbi:MAG: DUF58 domain-containing protein [bacterium]